MKFSKKIYKKIIPKIYFIFLILGWQHFLYADCSENQIKALISEEMMELKKKGFFDFKYTWYPHQDNEIHYRYTSKKKDNFGEDQVYGGQLIADTRVCDMLKESYLERLRPLSISDFKKEGLGSGEDCSLDKVKNIIYETLARSNEETKWEYPYGSIMKSWGYYEFVYTATSGDHGGKYHVDYLGRIGITKSKCYPKYNDLAAIRASWEVDNLRKKPSSDILNSFVLEGKE